MRKCINNLANLCNICNDCHRMLHGEDKELYRKKTSEGYEFYIQINC